jgi:hypothetical protein
MVLKVVTGKILETWELARGVAGAVPFWNRWYGSVVKDRDYLIDNLCVYMLSQLRVEVKRKAVERLIWFHFGNLGVAEMMLR